MPIITLKYLQQNARNQVLTRTSLLPGPPESSHRVLQNAFCKPSNVNFTELRCGRLSDSRPRSPLVVQQQSHTIDQIRAKCGRKCNRLTVLFSASTIFAVSKRGRDNSHTS